MAYKIIQSGNKEEFEMIMSDWINNGYTPVGNLETRKTCRIEQYVAGYNMSIYDTVYRQGVMKKESEK